MNTIETDKMIDLGQLIAQPLIATMQAEVSAAKNFVNFLQEYGMEEKTEEERTQLKMLTFTYSQTNPNTGKLENMSVQIPLLSLIPLPLLHIDSAEFDFDIRLFSQVEYQEHPGGQRGSLIPKTVNNGEDKKNEIGEFRGFQARLSPTVGRSQDGKASQTVDANMKVKIKMKQADLPSGLINLMPFFEKSISITPTPKNIAEGDNQTPAKSEANQPDSPK